MGKPLNRENRFDLGPNRFSKIQKTPQGFLRIPATLTRTGVLTYTRADGTKVRELRHPDEVFKEDSLATLRAAPLTNDHPGMISPENVSQHSIGTVSESISHDTRLVNGDVIVQRKDAIDGVNSGELKEISPGYTCAIDPTPGTYQGQRYDQAQQNIIYNHVALGPAGWGRSGPEVALRMDAAVSGIDEEFQSPEQPGEEINSMKKIRITLDGVTYEVEVAESLAPTFEASFAKIEQERADAKEATAKAEGVAAAAEKKAEELQKRLDAATDPAAIEAAAKERSEVIAKAEKIAPEAKFDGLNLEEIRKAALEAIGFERETMDSKGSAYIEGAFEAVKVEAKKDEPEAAGEVPGVSPKPPEKREDSEVLDAEASKLAMEKRGQDAWKTVN